MERMATSRRRPPCFPPKPNDESLGEGREKRDAHILGRQPKLSIATYPDCENQPIALGRLDFTVVDEVTSPDETATQGTRYLVHYNQPHS